MRKTILIITAAVAVIFGVSAVVSVTGGSTLPRPHAAVVAAETDSSAAAFTVRAYNGVVAVFSDGFDEPAFETDIDVSKLRGYDRELLEHGIKIGSYNELLQLLEDFSN